MLPIGLERQKTQGSQQTDLNHPSRNCHERMECASARSPWWPVWPGLCSPGWACLLAFWGGFEGILRRDRIGISGGSGQQRQAQRGFAGVVAVSALEAGREALALDALLAPVRQRQLGSSVRTRRSDMGLTQTTLAKLSGLSRATVNQVENGTINDLSLTRASRLLAVLGLSMTVTTPRPRHLKNRDAKSSAVDLAARTAGVSYRMAMSADQLRNALSTGVVSPQFMPHVLTLLEEAPVSLLAAVVEELHEELGVDRTQVWKKMRALAHQFKSSRELWL